MTEQKDSNSLFLQWMSLKATKGLTILICAQLRLNGDGHTACHACGISHSQVILVK
jgi:hypothetical protein